MSGGVARTLDQGVQRMFGVRAAEINFE